MPRETLDPLTHEPVLPRSEPARLDADRTAEPLTRMVGHARIGDCIGPGSVPPDAIEDTRTGERTSLGVGGSADAWKLTDDARNGKWGGGTMVPFPFEGVQALVQSLLDRASESERRFERLNEETLQEILGLKRERDEARAKLAEAERECEDLRLDLSRTQQERDNALRRANDPEGFYNRPEWSVPVGICSAHRDGCPPTCGVRIGSERVRFEATEAILAAVSRYRDACRLQAETGTHAIACQKACEELFAALDGGTAE